MDHRGNGRALTLALIGLGAIVLAAIAAQLVLAAGFKAKIEAWRQVVVAAQTPGPRDQGTIPEIVRAFAPRKGATLGGPAAVRSVQRDEMTTAPASRFYALDATQLSARSKGEASTLLEGPADHHPGAVRVAPV